MNRSENRNKRKLSNMDPPGGTVDRPGGTVDRPGGTVDRPGGTVDQPGEKDAVRTGPLDRL